MAGWQFWVDRGGTFTDIVAIAPDGKFLTHKLLSVNPSQYTNSAIQGIRDILGLSYEQPIEQYTIDSIKVGTTVATNALLERKGQATALLITKGFADALKIGNQNRPDIFALNIQLNQSLYQCQIEVEERILVDGSIETPLNINQLKVDLIKLKQQGYQSVAVVLMHAWFNPQHEQLVEMLAREVGFSQISLSHQVSQTIKLIPRGDTCVADAYLNPVMQDYVQQIADVMQNVPLFFMQSNGGLTLANQFKGKDAILSGPAGGIVGAIKTTQQAGFNKMIGFDMGGTSTDVTHFAGEYERIYQTDIAGIRISAPMMNIHTVAAGGGSICDYQDGRFQVGPESAGAFPGPACYRNDGPLTVTDCNVVLGKIQPSLFPKVFGENANQAIDKQAALKKIKQIQTALLTDQVEMSVEDIAQGFIQIAVDNMANAIAKISTQRGYDIHDYTLTCFGGAGGQHACLIADALNIDQILIHPYAGVLSAFGIGLAEQSQMQALSIQQVLTQENVDLLPTYYQAISAEQYAYLTKMASPNGQLCQQIYLLLKYQGAEVCFEVKLDSLANMRHAFEQAHLKQFGYLSDDVNIFIDSVIVQHQLVESMTMPVVPADSSPERSGITATFDSKAQDWVEVYVDVPQTSDSSKPDLNTNKQMTAIPVYQRADINQSVIQGPALIIEKTGTNMIESGWQAQVNSFNMLELTRCQKIAPPASFDIDPIKLEMFNNQFMAIAEQMGLTLARTAHSVNIRERLDFSCAIFNQQAELIANAPHVPVHLGSMSHSVQYVVDQIKHNQVSCHAGDSFIINSPYAGGTHLPDLTLITPVFIDGKAEFFVASRAHHADVGGITPGSMPAHSQTIVEEGLLFQGEKIAENYQLNTAWIRQYFSDKTVTPYPARNVEQNIADLAAQLAANKVGEKALIALTQQYSLTAIQNVMTAILDNGEQAVKNALQSLSSGEFCLKLDNGAQINVNISINENSADIDFTGTSKQQANNFNAPRSITDAAVIYVFRCLVNKPIPLNSGCMRPLNIQVETGSMLSPVYPAAVVAGNVELSQAIVSTLLLALKVQAAGQTTMNNVSFGNDEYQYYETLAGGSGAGCYATNDLSEGYAGTDAVHSHMTNSRLTDPEVLEQRFPVLLREFGIRKNSGGQGLFKGGNGLIREIEFCQPMSVNILTNSRVVAPPGLADGSAGSTGINRLIKADGVTNSLSSCCQFLVQPGDKFRIETPGGGGFGLLDKTQANF